MPLLPFKTMEIPYSFYYLDDQSTGKGRVLAHCVLMRNVGKRHSHCISNLVINNNKKVKLQTLPREDSN